MPTAHPLTSLLARPVGVLLAVAVGAAARALHQRPLHPWGVVLRAAVVVPGDAAQGLPPGRTEAVARLSLGAGLPRGLPDVVGLAVRWHGTDGSPQDLLFGSAGPGPLARFVPLPRLRPAGWFTTVMPLRTPSGPVLLGLRPDRETTRAAGTIAFEILRASPRGPWRHDGVLELLGPVAPGTPGGGTGELRFDPTRNAPRGLGTYPWEDRLRSPAYAAARRGAPTPRDRPWRT